MTSPRKPKKKAPDKSWARKTVDAMTPEEVQHWCRRLGIRVPDTRTPIERLVDEATSAAPKRRQK